MYEVLPFNPIRRQYLYSVYLCTAALGRAGSGLLYDPHPLETVLVSK